MIGWIVRTIAPNVLAWALIGTTGLAVAEGAVILVQQLRIDSLKAKPLRDTIRAQDRVIKVERAGVDATAALERQGERVRVEYRDRYITQLQRVPEYVTPETDRRFSLPVGFVRLHDYAATGARLPESDAAAGFGNDAASDVTASQAIGGIVANYAGCTDDRVKLTVLQAWANQVAPADPPPE